MKYFIIKSHPLTSSLNLTLLPRRSRIRSITRRCETAIGILNLVSQGEAEIRSGKTLSQEEVFGRLEEMLA